MVKFIRRTITYIVMYWSSILTWKSRFAFSILNTRTARSIYYNIVPLVRQSLGFCARRRCMERTAEATFAEARLIVIFHREGASVARPNRAVAIAYFGASA